MRAYTVTKVWQSRPHTFGPTSEYVRTYLSAILDTQLLDETQTNVVTPASKGSSSAAGGGESVQLTAQPDLYRNITLGFRQLKADIVSAQTDGRDSRDVRHITRIGVHEDRSLRQERGVVIIDLISALNSANASECVGVHFV